jgi:hypothetical protein
MSVFMIDFGYYTDYFDDFDDLINYFDMYFDVNFVYILMILN